MKLKKFFNFSNAKKIKKEKINRDIWLITGCASGIGYELCIELLKRGYKVAAGLRNKERLDNIREKYPEQLLLLEMDVTDEIQVTNGIKEVISKYGKIDVLINNAGISHFGTIEETCLTDIKEVFDTNFLGYVCVTKAVLPYMRKQKNGLIINISSVCGLEAFPGVTYYSASKFAIEGFSEALRKEVKDLNINVMCVNLSTARTPLSIKLKYNKPQISEYQKILHCGINTIENELEYKNSKVCPQKVAKSIISEAEFSNKTNLYLGSECINIAINKYKNILKELKKQKKFQHDVEYTDGE